MPTTTYEHRQEFVGAVAGLLPPEELPESLRRTLAEAIAQANATAVEEAREAGSGHELRIGHWFIRDDDLPFFATVGAVGPVVATLVSTAVVPPASVVSAAVALVAAFWKLWRKGGHLSSEQVAVLTTLNARGPLREDELIESLSGAGPTMSASSLRGLLQQLEDVELYDGTGVALVRRTREGAWRAVKV